MYEDMDAIASSGRSYPRFCCAENRLQVCVPMRLGRLLIVEQSRRSCYGGVRRMDGGGRAVRWKPYVRARYPRPRRCRRPPLRWLGLRHRRRLDVTTTGPTKSSIELARVVSVAEKNIPAASTPQGVSRPNIPNGSISSAKCAERVRH